VNDGELSLRVYPDDDALVWEATNAGKRNVRLWQQGNSWGWPMPRLHIDPEGDGNAPHTLYPAARVWTRNFPASVELAPQESTRYLLRAGDFDPEGLAAVQPLWQETLWAQGELHCDPSPEAVEYGVWSGTLRGEKQELSPPHAWLQA
jgi:hypothetical protein